MRRLLLAVVGIWLCACSGLAGAGLTVNDISLMLRSGHSSTAILTELTTRQFVGPLGADDEEALRMLHASPELIAALKEAQNPAPVNNASARPVFASPRIGERGQTTQETANTKRPMIQTNKAPQEQAAANQERTQPDTNRPEIDDRYLLPSEKDALKRYPYLTLSEVNSLTPKEMIATNAAKRAQKGEENRATAIELAKQAETQRQEAEEDRKQARRVVDQLQKGLLAGHSLEQLKRDLSMAKPAQCGPETQKVTDKMEKNLSLEHSPEQLKRDLFMLTAGESASVRVEILDRFNQLLATGTATPDVPAGQRTFWADDPQNADSLTAHATFLRQPDGQQMKLLNFYSYQDHDQRQYSFSTRSPRKH